MNDRAVRAVLGAGLVLVLAGVAITLAAADQRRAGTNLVRFDGRFVSVPNGEVLCQESEVVPVGTAAARVFARTLGDPAGVRLALVARRQRLAEARTARRSGDQLVFAFDRRLDAEHAAAICVRNLSGQLLELGGMSSPKRIAAKVGGALTRVRVTVEYLRAGQESWVSLVPTIADRAGAAHASFLGGSVLWLAVAAMFAAWILAGVACMWWR